MSRGRIVKALSGFYYVREADNIYQCRGRGIFRNRKISPLVGDIVTFEAENFTEGTITEIGERRNELIRPPIANIDQAILVFSCIEPAFSSFLLDRFLVLVESKNVKPIICLTKIDLLTEQGLHSIAKFQQEYQQLGYPVILLSTISKAGLQELTPFLKDKLSVIAGQSGVGKTSLLNALNEELNLATAKISTHLGRGKHTTRHVELMEIRGGWIADTPGFSQLDFQDFEATDLGEFFPEIRATSARCKFRGCLHLKEPDCAVKEEVSAGIIQPYRYQHYLQFLEEINDRKPRYN